MSQLVFQARSAPKRSVGELVPVREALPKAEKRYSKNIFSRIGGLNENINK
jgi:hypothetical protein